MLNCFSLCLSCHQDSLFIHAASLVDSDYDVMKENFYILLLLLFFLFQAAYPGKTAWRLC